MFIVPNWFIATHTQKLTKEEFDFKSNGFKSTHALVSQQLLKLKLKLMHLQHPKQQLHSHLQQLIHLHSQQLNSTHLQLMMQLNSQTQPFKPQYNIHKNMYIGFQNICLSNLPNLQPKEFKQLKNIRRVLKYVFKKMSTHCCSSPRGST